MIEEGWSEREEERESVQMCDVVARCIFMAWSTETSVCGARVRTTIVNTQYISFGSELYSWLEQVRGGLIRASGD